MTANLRRSLLLPGLLLLLAGCEPRARNPSRVDLGSGPDASAPDAPSAPDASTAPDAAVPDDAGTVMTGNILVSRVLDGDTVILSAGRGVESPDGQPLDGERVRFIGIDTPEISHDGAPPDCFGNEAAAYTRSRIEGRLVTLEYDFSTGLRDAFGRILAYVSVDGEVLNETLLREGYARVFRRFTFRDRSAYLAIEADAQGRGAGLWSACP